MEESGREPSPSEHASDVSGACVDSQPKRCLRCSARRLNCDSKKPRCNKCSVDGVAACSYDWNLTSIVALFPPEYDMNKKVSLRSVEEHTDHGGFGKVYRTSLKQDGSWSLLRLIGREPTPGTAYVAVKALFQRKQTPERLQLLALREALTWSQLHHDHIVPLIGVADYSKICKGAPPRLCLISPWMTSGNVMEYIAEHPTADRKTILFDVADAVCYLHKCSPVVIHGDIRGSNILVDVLDGRPAARLTDFGLSFLVEESGRSGALYSTSTARDGHPRWLAPERLFPETFDLSPYKSKSEASDVFELGRTILEILTGQCPFFGSNDFQVVRMVTEGKHPDRPSLAIKELLTDAIWTTLERLWTQDRQERPCAAKVRAIVATEIIIERKVSDLSFLKRLPSPDLISLLRLGYYDNSLDPAALLDAIIFAFTSFDKADAITCLIVGSRVLLSDGPLPSLRSAVILLKHVGGLMKKRATKGWRHRHIDLYAGSEGCLVSAELHVLAVAHDLSLRTEVLQHLTSLLGDSDIGGVCRNWIIASGRLPAALVDFKDYWKTTTEQGQDYLGLTLIKAITSSHDPEAFADTFLRAGLLPALSRCFKDEDPLYWDVIVTWANLLGILRNTKAAQTWQVVLRAEHKLGWESLATRSGSVMMSRSASHEFRTVLHAAASVGHEPTVRVLLEGGADVSARTKSGWTALHQASYGGHETTVRVLLNGGADVSARTDKGWTALYAASRQGHETTVRVLLNGGADVSARAKSGWTALHQASYGGHETTVRVLLNGGADVSARTDKGWTALYAASRQGHETTVRVLLNGGADVSPRAKSGWTALHQASYGGHETTVRVLLNGGADVSARTESGWTALHEASNAGHETTVRVLLNGGADVSARTESGWTALHQASNAGHETTVRVLLNGGADVNAQTDKGWTALYAASRQGHETTVRVLLNGGADVSARTESGWTALYAASRKGHETTVRVLLNGGADVNAQTDKGWTALHEASQAEREHETIVRLLLESGADVNARDDMGWTALFYAWRLDHKMVQQVLLQHGGTRL